MRTTNVLYSLKLVYAVNSFSHTHNKSNKKVVYIMYLRITSNAHQKSVQDCGSVFVRSTTTALVCTTKSALPKGVVKRLVVKLGQEATHMQGRNYEWRY